MKETFQRRIINNLNSSAQYERETHGALWLKKLVANVYQKSGHMIISRPKTSPKVFFKVSIYTTH
jgi:hypothetical protein